MEPIPLTLSILKLTPITLFNTQPPSAHIEDVPLTPAPRPSLPSSFAFSPTHNYPAPFGSMTLGTSLGVRVQLIANPPSSPRPGSSNAGDIGDVAMGGEGDVTGVQGVKGVKMMLEIQGPGGRWRLGEVVHGEDPEVESGVEVKGEAAGAEDEKEVEGVDAEDKGGDLNPEVKEEGVERIEREGESAGEKKKVPILPPGEFVEMDVQAEMKELGLQVLICSVAWETATGRRTFQRFYKFNVVAPLSIKTKIHPSQTPMSQLDPERRSDVYLEVLMQNISTESILFDKVNLEPVFGMTAKSITPDTDASIPTGESDPTPDSLGSLHPGDTRQYLFLLHPQPPPSTKSRQSVFAPVFTPGTILPLGRLDMAWLAGPHRERGRLQTSTLNRRVAAAPVAPKIAPIPTRTSVAPSTPGQGVGTPTRVPSRLRDRNDEYAEDEYPEWEIDLAVMDLERSGVEVEKEFAAKLRVGIRSRRTFSPNADQALGGEDGPPASVRIGIQYLASFETSGPAFTSPPNSDIANRPDLTQHTAAGPSRPMTPISSQLRNATQTHLNGPSAISFTPISNPTFPPAPVLQRPAPPPKSQPLRKEGEIFPLGPSLLLPPPNCFELAQEQYSTTYADLSEPPERWEAVYEVEMKFLALEEGMAKLGGVRVLIMADEEGTSGAVATEWETLGDVWVSG